MKNIGVLTHAVANNFGANLQALSTGLYLRNHGCQPVFFRWSDYLNDNSEAQAKIHESFLESHGFIVSKSCHKNEDFISVMKEYDVKDVIVGSDCVLTYAGKQFPYTFTRRGIVKKADTSADYKFPNPFWLPFIEDGFKGHLVMMSASSGSSKYSNIPKETLLSMRQLLSRYDFISARDSESKKMIDYILRDNTRDIQVTPDPVFGFNNNFLRQESRESFKSRYALPDKYIFLSFYGEFWPSQEWADSFMKSCHEAGITCVSTRMPLSGSRSSFDVMIEHPLNPIDWYYFIKYSDGYVGNNMHPMIVAIHNNVPFFDFNIHGRFMLNRHIQLVKTSKEYDLLRRFSMQDWQIAQKRFNHITPQEVLKKIQTFDKEKCKHVSEQLCKEYLYMMNRICAIIEI